VIVSGKSVRIVESHEEVLAEWAEAAHDVGAPLTLVTLDRHTDTSPALTTSFADGDDDGDDWDDADGDDNASDRRRNRALSRFRGVPPGHLDALIDRLENDEHIDAALRLGVLSRALIISSQAGRTGESTIEGATVFRPACAPDCTEASHESASCERRRFDAILESDLLRPALAQLGFDLTSPPRYVLDIDLDTFSTRRGLEPADATVFHGLIVGAHSITLAREPEYVNESLDDHDSDEIEAAVLGHVRRAMPPDASAVQPSVSG